MIDTQAVVISLEGNIALVEASQGGGCGNCDNENGCGSGNLSKLFSSKPRRFRVRNDANAQVGSVVHVALAEGLLLRSAMVMYVLPLILLLVGSVLGEHWFDDITRADVGSIIGGSIGLVLGFAVAKLASSQHRLLAVAQPVILPVIVVKSAYISH